VGFFIGMRLPSMAPKHHAPILEALHHPDLIRRADRPPDIFYFKIMDEDFAEPVDGGVNTQCKYAVMRHSNLVAIWRSVLQCARKFRVITSFSLTVFVRCWVF
jgi:hypothetical protein